MVDESGATGSNLNVDVTRNEQLASNHMEKSEASIY